MLECVPNVAEGRRDDVVGSLAAACGPSLLDVHRDADHHRCVFTLAGPAARDAEHAARRLARAVAESGLDVSMQRGVHPRLGLLDVVPFTALDGENDATEAARTFGSWLAAGLGVPVFFYGAADDRGVSLPDVRRDAFTRRAPDVGPARPHPRLGATAVGARPLMVAVNCELDRDDLELARDIARRVRERDGGLPGVRALGFALASRHRAQVSMNLVALGSTGIEAACTAVRDLARTAGAEVSSVELVGLLPRAELTRCSDGFRGWSGLSDDHTVEARLARARGAEHVGGDGGPGAREA